MMKLNYTCDCQDYKGKPLTYHKTLITPNLQTANLIIEAWNIMGKGSFKYSLGQSMPMTREEKKNLVESPNQPSRYFLEA